MIRQKRKTINEEQKKPQAEKLDDEQLDRVAGGVKTTAQTVYYIDDILRKIIDDDPGYGHGTYKG